MIFKNKLISSISVKFIFFAVIAFTTVISTCYAKTLPDETKYLGVNRSAWAEEIKSFKNIKNEVYFFDSLKQSENELKNTRDSEHFEKLDQVTSLKDKHKSNPLMQLKPRKNPSKYMTDLNLDKNDYQKLLTILHILNNYYDEERLGEIAPYIALCLNKGIVMADLRYYSRLFIKQEPPIDIACHRLYMLVDNSSQFDRDIWKR